MNHFVKKPDYCKKVYHNPYFSNEVKPKNKKIKFDISTSWVVKFPFKFWLVILGIIFLIILAIWLIIFSSFLSIKTIEINKLKNIETTEIEKIIWQQTEEKRFIFSQTHLALFDKGELINKLANYNFEKINIIKKIPHTLKIEIKEKDISLGWFEDNKYYLLDSLGNIIKQGRGNEKNIVFVYNLGSFKLNGLRIVIPDNFYLFAINLNNEFKKRFSTYKINQIFVDNEKASLKLSIDNNIEIYFNINSDLNRQLVKLEALIKQELKNKLNKISYIDLRYGDKIFYK